MARGYDNAANLVGATSEKTAAAPAQFIKTVAAAGTPEALSATPLLCQSATLVGVKAARTNNVGTVYIGVTAGNDAQFVPLTPGATLILEAAPGQAIDLGGVYCDVVTNGDGVGVLYS